MKTLLLIRTCSSIGSNRSMSCIESLDDDEKYLGCAVKGSDDG